MPVRPNRPKLLPENFPRSPTAYPVNLFRLEVDAARRFLFEPELKEVLDVASLSHDLMNPTGSYIAISVAQVSTFMQELKAIVGEDKAYSYGQEAFLKVAPLIPKPNPMSPMWRAVSSIDKLFLRIRDSMAGFNRQIGASVLVKWHGGHESDLFEDTAQHCYGYTWDAPACQTQTGFLQAAIGYLSGIQVELTETECMATGALTCRWKCILK